MVKVYFKNVRSGRRYLVVRMTKKTVTNDKGDAIEVQEVTLKGDYAEFTEPYTKARFEKLGYVLETEDNNDTH